MQVECHIELLTKYLSTRTMALEMLLSWLASSSLLLFSRSCYFRDPALQKLLNLKLNIIANRKSNFPYSKYGRVYDIWLHSIMDVVLFRTVIPLFHYTLTQCWGLIMRNSQEACDLEIQFKCFSTLTKCWWLWNTFGCYDNCLLFAIGKHPKSMSP